MARLTICFYFNNLSSESLTHSTGRMNVNNVLQAVCNELKDNTYQGSCSKAVFYFDNSGDNLEIRYRNGYQYFVEGIRVTRNAFLELLKKITL